MQLFTQKTLPGAQLLDRVHDRVQGDVARGDESILSNSYLPPIPREAFGVRLLIGSSLNAFANRTDAPEAVNQSFGNNLFELAVGILAKIPYGINWAWMRTKLLIVRLGDMGQDTAKKFDSSQELSPAMLKVEDNRMAVPMHRTAAQLLDHLKSLKPSDRIFVVECLSKITTNHIKLSFNFPGSTKSSISTKKKLLRAMGETYLSLQDYKKCSSVELLSKLKDVVNIGNLSQLLFGSKNFQKLPDGLLASLQKPFFSNKFNSSSYDQHLSSLCANGGPAGHAFEKLYSNLWNTANQKGDSSESKVIFHFVDLLKVSNRLVTVLADYENAKAQWGHIAAHHSERVNVDSSEMEIGILDSSRSDYDIAKKLVDGQFYELSLEKSHQRDRLKNGLPAQGLINLCDYVEKHTKALREGIVNCNV